MHGFAKSFDLFGIRPTVYFQGKSKSGTNFGFFLSILLLTFASICFGYFGQDLYYRRNPRMISHNQYTPIPEKIILDPELMPIIIELNSPFGDIYYTNPNILYLTVSQLTIKRKINDTEVTFQDYPMEICTKDHFSKLEGETQEYFLKKKLIDYFCIPTNLKNLTMQGAFDQDIFQAIKFTVAICKNDTGKTTCLPKEDIAKTIGRGFLGIYFVDYTINPSDYENPKKGQPKEVFTNFVLNSQREIEVFLKNNYLKTENGLVFENNHEERIVNFANSKEFDFRTENPDFFCAYFKIDQESAFTERSYLKLQDLFAQIGGFINCFWIVAVILNHFYSNLFIICETIVNVFTVKIFVDDLKKTEEINIKKDKKPKIEENEKNGKNSIANQKNLITIPIKKEKIDNIKIQRNPNISNKFLIDEMNEFEIVKTCQRPLNIKKSAFSSQIQSVSFEDIHLEKEIQNSFNSSNRIAEFQKLQKTEEDIKNFQTIENLQLRFLDYVYYYTGCFKTPEREKKKMIIKKGSNILKKCLDIKYIIQKFYEIEKLKFILLSDLDIDQFAHLPKPELKIVSIKDKFEKKKFSVVTNILCKNVDIDQLNQVMSEKLKSLKKKKFSKK